MSVEISVIIPCYNAGKFILSTLHSLEAQTFRDFEVIIVNDGSIDDSGTIIEEYMEQSTKGLTVRYFYQENKGVSAARNRGIQQANGRYITFLDADDIYHPEFLQILFNCMEKFYIDIACCRYKRIDEGFQLDKSVQGLKNVRRLNREGLLEEYLHKRKTKLNFFNAMYKKSIMMEHNLVFPAHIKYGEDSEFFCKYLAHCDSGGILIDNELYGYVNQPMSAVNAKKTWRRTDNLIATQDIIDYWRAQNLDTGFEEYMFARALWAMAKDFAKADDRELIHRLENEYSVSEAMRIMAKSGDELTIRISAFLYLIHKRLFYLLVSKAG